MKKLVLLLAVLALVPAVASADDLSANLSGACQGFASLVTSGSTISYGIISNHPDPNQAVISGGGVNINLQANFAGGSAAGTVSASTADIAAINQNAGGFNLQVSGPSGQCQGALANNGSSGTGTAGVLEFATATYTVLETAGEVTISVNRAGGTSGVVTVDYATADGTAVAGTDYQAASGTLTWGDGESAAQTFTVQIFDNGMEDGDKTFNLTLTDPTGGAELGLSAATTTIIDDESLVCVADEDTLCLNRDGRFKAEIEWAAFDGSSGRGQAFEIGLRDSGLFYFFGEDNIEMLLKVLDACNLEGFNSYWVFYAATTNVEFTLTITDTANGATKVYGNALGNPAAPVLDTGAFMTCP